MSAASEELADRLSQIADDLGDLAIDRIRESLSAARSGEGPDPAVVAEEKRITRARRSVEKAITLLRTE